MPRPTKQVLLTAIGLVANAVLVASPASAATVWGQEWQTNGNATAMSSSHIVLTPNANDQVGSAWVTTPLAVTDSSAFSASFEFRISGSNEDFGPGDGMAFVMHGGDEFELGNGGGDLGYGGIGGPLLAVEFDTFVVYPAEPEAEHVAIHRNGIGVANLSVPNNGQVTAVGPYQVLVRGGVGAESNLFAWVDFDPGTTTLSVFLNDTNVKPDDALAYFVIGSGLQTYFGSNNVTFGFSAATGAASSQHEVFNFSTTPVPLPAAAWLLLSGLGGLGVLGRRRKAA